jgi:serine/threonine protein kinase
VRVSHPNIVCMLDYDENSETQICGDSTKVNCFYEYFNLNLKKELAKRVQANSPFKETEIWYILESLISALSYFESYNIYHGDIRPMNILLTHEG